MGRLIEMRRKFFVMAAAFALALFAAAQAFAVGSGQMARDIVLRDMAGGDVSLDSFKGKTVVLNFWATWCPPCRGEMPEFDELDKEFKKTGEAVLLAVNLTDGRRETKERVEKFMKETGYGMTVLLDDKQEAAMFFGVRYIPTTFVLNENGELVGQIQGATTKDAVLKLVREGK